VIEYQSQNEIHRALLKLTLVKNLARWYQGLIEPPKVARGHVTSVNGKFKITLFIERRYYY